MDAPTTRRRTALGFLEAVDRLRDRQFGFRRAFSASLRRSLAEPLRYVIGLGWAIGWTVVAQIMGDGHATVAITALIFSMLISSLAAFPWRVRLLPRRLRSRWLLLLANGALAALFGYLCFNLSLWCAALAHYGVGVLGDNFTANLQSFGRIATIGLIMPLIGFPIVLGEEHERVMRTMKGRQQRMQALAGEARQIALRSQINPHFFFNALNTIAALIPTRPREAERAVVLLAESLRPVLMRTPSLVATVASELDVARAYAEMEQLRLGDRLVVHFDAAPEVLQDLLPSLCIQPLLENAVTHGVARRSGVQRIDVAARRAGAGTLEVDIRDGAALEWTEQDRESEKAAPRKEGHALANVGMRLAALHGDKGELDVRAGEHGCWARLRLPGVESLPRRADAPQPLQAGAR